MTIVFSNRSDVTAIDMSDLENRRFARRLSSKILFDQFCDKFFPENIAYLVKSLIDIKAVLSKEKSTTDFHQLCMNLYHINPSIYMALRKAYSLPPKRAIIHICGQSIAQSFPTRLKTMKPKIHCLSMKGKQCIAFIGQVELKPHLYYHVKEDKIYGFCENKGNQMLQVARHALVLIVRGIYEKWTLPMDYALFYTRDPSARSRWIRKTISDVIEAGLMVCACMLEKGSKITASEMGNEVTTEAPFFQVERGSKIYLVYDPTYIMVTVYRCLMTHEFHYKNTIAKWQDVLEFYKGDSKREHRLAPELLETHVVPNFGHEMEARFAVETLSERVASGISAYVDFGQIDESARGTVNLLSMMSKFYMFMNSSNARNTSEYQKPFSGNEHQTRFVREMLNFFQNLKVIKDGKDVTHKVDILKQLQISIRAIILLFEDLNEEKITLQLYTHHFNFNIMNTFLNSIREQSTTKDFTAWRIISAFRKMVYSNILKTSGNKTCPELVSNIFNEYLQNTSYLREPPADFRSNFKVSSLSLPVKKSDYQHFELPAKEQLITISQFLWQKSCDLHNKCSLPKLEKPNQYVYPAADMHRFVETLENKVKEAFQKYFFTKRLFVTMEESKKDLINSLKLPCKCFPVMFMIILFFRLRISQQLRANNRIFRESSNEDLFFCYKNFS